MRITFPLFILLCAGVVFAQSDKPTPWPMTTSQSASVFQMEPGPFMAINATDGVLIVNDKNGATMVSVDRGGKVTYGKDYKPDEVARTFWETLAKSYPQVCEKLQAPPSAKDGK